jgi:hypothetical protein
MDNCYSHPAGLKSEKMDHMGAVQCAAGYTQCLQMGQQAEDLRERNYYMLFPSRVVSAFLGSLFTQATRERKQLRFVQAHGSTLSLLIYHHVVRAFQMGASRALTPDGKLEKTSPPLYI